MDGNDPDRDAYLLADYAYRLLGITEVEICIMVEYYIENVKNAFFPQYAQMKDFLENEFKEAPWSKYFSGGVEAKKNLTGG